MKKPGEFKKQQKKHQNIQHKRDQLKLLKEEKIQEAELFILDPDGFKKVYIKSFPEVPYDAYGRYETTNVVYVQRKHKKTRLRTSQLIGKDAYPRCKVEGPGFIEWEDCLGIIIKTEMLKPKN